MTLISALQLNDVLKTALQKSIDLLPGTTPQLYDFFVSKPILVVRYCHIYVIE